MNGEERVKFDRLPVGQKFSWLYDEMESVKGNVVNLVETAKENGRWMKRIGIGILLAVITAAVGIWVKG